VSEHFDPEHAFTIGQGLREGFSRRDLNHSVLEHPFHGLRAVRRPPGEHDGLSAGEAQRDRIERAALRFSVYMGSHEFLSHTTAAGLWGIPLPLLDDEAIHVSVRAPRRAPRGAGVRGHQLSERLSEVVEHPDLGLRVTAPATTWGLLGLLLRHPYDLVAAADGIVRVDRVAGPRGFVKRPALAALRDLEQAIPRKRKGVAALREALPRVRPGAASRPETWLRLTLCDAGLPEPETDVDVYDESGEFLGCVDLAYQRYKVALEYEGDHHRTSREQWNRDLEKHAALTRAGWRVIRVTAGMLFVEPAPLIADVRAALHARR
jgi:hypothetical protein